MRVKRCVLQHHTRRNADAEWCEVPYPFDPSLNHVVRYLLGIARGDSKHTDLGIHLFVPFNKIIGVKHGNAMYLFVDDGGLYVETSDYFQAILLKTRVR